MIKEVNTTEFSLTLNDKYLEIIARRGEELAKMHPELDKDIRAYIDLQAEECDVIRDHIEGAIWLLQKREKDTRERPKQDQSGRFVEV